MAAPPQKRATVPFSYPRPQPRSRLSLPAVIELIFSRKKSRPDSPEQHLLASPASARRPSWDWDFPTGSHASMSAEPIDLRIHTASPIGILPLPDDLVRESLQRSATSPEEGFRGAPASLAWTAPQSHAPNRVQLLCDATGSYVPWQSLPTLHEFYEPPGTPTPGSSVSSASSYRTGPSTPPVMAIETRARPPALVIDTLGATKPPQHRHNSEPIARSGVWLCSRPSSCEPHSPRERSPAPTTRSSVLRNEGEHGPCLSSHRRVSIGEVSPVESPTKVGLVRRPTPGRRSHTAPGAVMRDKDIPSLY